MAENIKSVCRSCFHSYVCEQFNEHRDSYNEKCHFFNDHFVPAADVVEVKHGEWKIAERDMSTRTVLVECSECYALLNVSMIAFGLNYDYCPNCGARMKG